MLFDAIVAGDMEGDITGTVFAIPDGTTKLFLSAIWTAASDAPTGTIKVYASIDSSRWHYIDDVTWSEQPAGSASSAWANIYELAARFLRVDYTAGSGGAGETLDVNGYAVC